MSIQEFVDKTKEKHREHLRNHHSLGVTGKTIIWSEELAMAGYITVKLTGSTDWPNLHQWCIDNIGENHYTWTGLDFWFENEQDAVMFSLRWS